MEMTDDERRRLLETARGSIAAAMRGRRFAADRVATPALKEKSGAFVTLHIKGELRGCIGYIEARMPLLETVEEAAEKAAFEDPRFLPLSEEELKDIEIEISVLSPLRRIKDETEVQVGTHGLVIDGGYTRGLLLPQVATEYGWNREQFLAQTCRKAGLPADSWRKKEIGIYVFTCDVFSEHQLMGSTRAHS